MNFVKLIDSIGIAILLANLVFLLVFLVIMGMRALSQL